MERVWITGGRGFVGRYLADELGRRGTHVWVIDRGDDDEDAATHWLGIDLSDPDSVGRAIAATSPDAIVHLAAQSSGGLSFSIPGETLRNNLGITLGLLEGIRQTASDRRPRLISVGSCEEYGAPANEAELPLREDQTLRPGNPYAVSKAAQTLLAQQYRRSHDLPILCVRAFTHTGPGQSERFVFGSWVAQIARLEAAGGGTLQVGNLDVSRDLSDVREIVRAYADLLEVEWPADTVNVGSGREIALRDALDHLRARARARIEVEVDPARLRPSDVPRFVGDVSRLQKMLGWVPSAPFEDTLDDMLAAARVALGA